jgi:beta-1,4-mannosyl-glycoprotein beta-1,4-N-acetylglucosaminyltransferase
MIYDLIPYCGEDLILELRINELKDVVDKFILLESPKSHTRIDKPLLFDINNFPGFEDKIEYQSIDYCTYENPFYNDEMGRIVLYNIVREKLTKKDIVLHGDLDEIPNSAILQTAIDKYWQAAAPMTLSMKNRVLCLDLEQTGLKFPGTSILTRVDIEMCGLNNLRNNRQNSHFTQFLLVENAGWHFTYNMGLDKTINKLKYFAHAPETMSWARTKEDLVKCIKTKTSIDKDTKLERVAFTNDNFPEYILNNPEKYKENLSFNYD